MDRLVEHVVAWHNRHPLAKRITIYDVHTIGVVALPFMRNGSPNAPAAGGSGGVRASARKGGGRPDKAIEPVLSDEVSPDSLPAWAEESTVAANTNAAALDALADQEPFSPPPGLGSRLREALAGWLPWGMGGAAADGSWPVFSERFIPGLSLRHIARFAQRYGFEQQPGGADLPQRIVPIDDGLMDGSKRAKAWGGKPAPGSAGGAWPCEFYLMSAAIDAGRSRTRVLAGRSRPVPHITGRRCLSPWRLGLAALLPLTVLGLLLLPPLLHRSGGDGADDHGAAPPTAASSPAAMAASAAAAAAIEASAASAAMTAPAEPLDLREAAQLAAAQEAALQAARQAAAEPQESAEKATDKATEKAAAGAEASSDSTRLDTEEPKPDIRPVFVKPIPRKNARPMLADPLPAEGASAAGMPASASESKSAEPSPTNTSPPPATTTATTTTTTAAGARPQAIKPSAITAGRITSKAHGKPALHANIGTADGGSAATEGAGANAQPRPSTARSVTQGAAAAPARDPAAGQQVVALVGPVSASKAEAEAMLERMRKALVGGEGDAGRRQAQVFQTPEGWRPAVWPFASREEAQLINATLVARGLRTRAVDF